MITIKPFELPIEIHVCSFINDFDAHDDHLINTDSSLTGLECNDKFYSIEEGKCIDVTVPGAIPNWFGAPAVK